MTQAAKIGLIRLGCLLMVTVAVWFSFSARAVHFNVVIAEASSDETGQADSSETDFG